MQYDSKKLIEKLNESAKRSGRRGLDPTAGKGYELQKGKWTVNGLIVGIVSGIPLGLFVELWRFLTAQPFDDFFIAIIILVIAVAVCTIAGYIYGTYLDGST